MEKLPGGDKSNLAKTAASIAKKTQEYTQVEKMSDEKLKERIRQFTSMQVELTMNQNGQPNASGLLDGIYEFSLTTDCLSLLITRLQSNSRVERKQFNSLAECYNFLRELS